MGCCLYLPYRICMHYSWLIQAGRSGRPDISTLCHRMGWRGCCPCRCSQLDTWYIASLQPGSTDLVYMKRTELKLARPDLLYRPHTVDNSWCLQECRFQPCTSRKACQHSSPCPQYQHHKGCTWQPTQASTCPLRRLCTAWLPNCRGRPCLPRKSCTWVHLLQSKILVGTFYTGWTSLCPNQLSQERTCHK